ncbi:MAG: WG repeat-containing protein, partial [Bacteroidota bacterium]
MIDKSGKEVVAPAYYQIGNFSDGLAWVQSKQGGNFGYIDANGKLVIDTTLNYVGVHSFSDGLAIVENRVVNPENGEEHILFGYIDKTGKEIIPLKYISAEDFRNGKAKVENNQYTELYIDKNGNVVK